MASTIACGGRRMAMTARASSGTRPTRARRGFTWILLLTVMGLHSSADAADFACTAGDVQCIVDAITIANTNAEVNRLTLAAGAYTFTTPHDGGENALPVVTGTLQIRGIESATILVRATIDFSFRFLAIAETADVVLDGLVIQGFGNGMTPRDFMRGGAILNNGSLEVLNTTIAGNEARTAGDNFSFGGGIYNAGTLTLRRTSVTGNRSPAQGGEGGGIYNSGSLTVEESSLTGNSAGGFFARGGGAISNYGSAVLTSSTVAMNVSVNGGAIRNSGATGSLVILNSTIADNTGGLVTSGAELQNSIVARNRPTDSYRDCSGVVTSLGSNLFGDLTGCAVALQSGDIVGDPLLGGFLDDGVPGSGRLPLQPGSPAIDAANEQACPPTDQLGRARLGRCDIGAIEFHPLPNAIIVNHFLTLTAVPGTYRTSALATGCPAGFSGTFSFTGRLASLAGSPDLTHLRVRVNTVTPGYLLQNAEAEPGGTAARVMVPRNGSYADGVLSAGEAVDVPFVICLPDRTPFQLFVDVVGVEE